MFLMILDWRSMFVPTMSVVEIIVRGVCVYLFLLLLFRLLRREAGAIGVSDLLVVVLIADAAQNAMGAEYKSLTEGAVLVSTIVACDYSLDWLTFRFPFIRKILRPAALPLINDGQLQRRNLRQEMISIEELMGLLRQEGVENIGDVKRCFLEADGHLSVIKQKKTEND